MFRCPNDILSIHFEDCHVIDILNSADRDKEKFIIGFQLLYSANNDIGFRLLRAVKKLDTCLIIESAFIENLLEPEANSLSLAKTVKVIQYILDNASHPEQFDMAIHQHLTQYAQTKMDTSNLNEILVYIKAITDRIDNITSEFMTTVCTLIMTRISLVPVPREAENIQALNVDSIQIIEFFQNLSTIPRHDGISIHILIKVYELITRDEEVSPLTCLGLAVIPDQYIGTAVSHILTVNRGFNNQPNAIKNAIGRLVMWLRTTKFDVPLHLWIVKVMTALHDEKHYDILNEVILEHIVPCYLTLIVPAFQSRTLVVVQAMFETQRSEEIFFKIAPRFVRVLTHLETKKSKIFEPLLDIVSDYVSNFPNVEYSCKEIVEFLVVHQRSINRSSSKYRRLAGASSLSSNVRIGLENLGNTCYMNSVIQALFMTKSFCNELLSINRSDRDTMVVQKIFGLLMFSERSELNLKFAMSHIRPEDFIPGMQQDSSEFMGSLLDKLHEADKKFMKTTGDWDEEAPQNEVACSNNDNVIPLDVTKEAPMETGDGDMNVMVEAKVSIDKVVDNTSELNQATVVQKIFGGKLSTTCVCSSCDSKSISIDSFRDLALSFPEKEKNEDDWNSDIEYSVQQLLDFYFTSEQLTLDGDNQYHCEKCKSLCDGVRCTELLQPPKNLILTLKHFRYDSRYHTRSKLLINKMIHDEEITVKVRSSHEGNSARTVSYRLYAAVVHSGVSLDSGHYYTFAREKDDVWYKFNDSYVSTSTLHELHNLNSPNTPYILFYRRISTASATASSSTACSSDQLVSTEDKVPNFLDLQPFLKSFIEDDNNAYKKESKKFTFQPNKSISKAKQWWPEDHDDPPNSSCGNNFDVQPNRFIF